MHYKPTKPFSTSGEIKLLEAINDIYSDFPSYGYRMHKQLLRDGHNVGKKFVNKVMKYMGIEALYLKPSTTTIMPPTDCPGFLTCKSADYL